MRQQKKGTVPECKVHFHFGNGSSLCFFSPLKKVERVLHEKGRALKDKISAVVAKKNMTTSPFGLVMSAAGATAFIAQKGLGRKKEKEEEGLASVRQKFRSRLCLEIKMFSLQIENIFKISEYRYDFPFSFGGKDIQDARSREKKNPFS